MKNWKKVLLACLCLAAAGTPAVSAVSVMASETTDIGEAPVVSGLQTVNGKIYYYENGKAVKKVWKKIGNAKYYFGKDGAAYAAGSDRNVLVKKIGGYYYGFNKKGQMLAGKFYNVKIKSGSKTVTYRYYFTSSGKAYAGKKTTYGIELAVKKINGKWYGFLENGRMAKGIYLNAKNNKLYYFNAKNGVYSSARSKKLNSAANKAESDARAVNYKPTAATMQSITALKNLLGTAQKTQQVDGCLIDASDGTECLIYYQNVVLDITRNYSGQESLISVMSR